MSSLMALHEIHIHADVIGIKSENYVSDISILYTS